MLTYNLPLYFSVARTIRSAPTTKFLQFICYPLAISIVAQRISARTVTLTLQRNITVR